MQAIGSGECQCAVGAVLTLHPVQNLTAATTHKRVNKALNLNKLNLLTYLHFSTVDPFVSKCLCTYLLKGTNYVLAFIDVYFSISVALCTLPCCVCLCLTYNMKSASFVYPAMVWMAALLQYISMCIKLYFITSLVQSRLDNLLKLQMEPIMAGCNRKSRFW